MTGERICGSEEIAKSSPRRDILIYHLSLKCYCGIVSWKEWLTKDWYNEWKIEKN